MANIKYFPGLNELRALAAISVIPGHIEQTKGILGLGSNYWFPIPGKWAVILFFVISGFLITTLLLKEKEQTKNISLKSFYAKRALRIWPLYFLIIFLSFFILNKIELFKLPPYSSILYNYIDTKSMLFILFVLPNYAAITIPYASQTWSIGVEEQFYFMQPFIIKYVKKIWFIIVLMLIIIFAQEIFSLLNFLKIDIIKKIPWSYFGTIAIGAVGAVVYYKYPDIIKLIVYSKIVQFLTLGSFIIFVYIANKKHSEHIVDFRILAVIFIIIVLNASTNPKSLYNLKNKTLDYLGRISYGIYIYHGIGIIFAIRLTQYILPKHMHIGFLFNFIIYFLTIAFTIAISVLSYRFFESWFLKFKNNLKK